MDSLEAIIVIVVAGAIAVGVIGDRFFRRPAPEKDRPSVSDVVGFAITLSVVLMAFVLVEASDSYVSARQAATAEAHAVDTLFETAEYVPEPERESITGKVVCYSRAILSFEWEHMGSGRAPEASVWSSRIRDDFKAFPDKDSQMFKALIDADSSRSAHRRQRLEESTPSTPAPVYILMLATLAVAIGGYLLAIGPGHPQVVAVTILLAALLTFTLLLIRDLERPFNGVNAIGSAALRDVRDDITQDFTAAYGDRLPCRPNGLPR